MEKCSTQQSTVSSASRANEQTPDRELHNRPQTNNTLDTTKTTIHKTQQRDHVHCTSSQNQCAQDSAGQNAQMPTFEQTIGNHTPTMGMDENTPHKDRGTQMPSQEIYTNTITQGTQIPSQQWEQASTNEDHEAEQSSINFLDTTSLNPSSRLGVYQGTFARQPTHTPALDTKTVSTVELHQKTTIHPKPVIIQAGHKPIQIVDTWTERDGKKIHSVHKTGQNPEDTGPGTKIIPKAPQIHHNNLQINTGNKTEGSPTKNNPHIVTVSALGILNTTKGSPKNNTVEIIARVNQGVGPSITSTVSTSDIKPNTGHTHSDFYTGR